MSPAKGSIKQDVHLRLDLLPLTDQTVELASSMRSIAALLHQAANILESLPDRFARLAEVRESNREQP